MEFRPFINLVFHSTLYHRKTSLLHGNDPWAIYESWICENVGRDSNSSWYRNWTNHCNCVSCFSWLFLNFFKNLFLRIFSKFRSVLSYYCCLVAITIYYFIASFNSELPWGKCDPEWINCVDSTPSDEPAHEPVNNLTTIRQTSSSEYYFL